MGNPKPKKNSVPAVVALAIASACCGAMAAGKTAAPDSAADLKFGEFFKMPVGARGLEPTGKLLGLDGKQVRIVGYLAHQDAAQGGLLYLTPFPVELSEEDEPLADDLPASTVFVHLPSETKTAPRVPGLVRLVGKLSVGAKNEPDGRVSAVRLQLDPALANSLTHP